MISLIKVINFGEFIKNGLFNVAWLPINLHPSKNANIVTPFKKMKDFRSQISQQKLRQTSIMSFFSRSQS
jgi:hypothetical protein